jgi:chromosome segregation ATPase
MTLKNISTEVISRCQRPISLPLRWFPKLYALFVASLLQFAAMEETAERQVEALRVQIRDGLEQRRLWKGAFVEAKDELAALQEKALQEAAYLQTQLRKAQEQQEILTQSSNDSVDAGELAAVDSEMAQRNNLLLKQLLSQLEEAVGVSEKLQLQLGEAQQISASAQLRADAAEAALTERSALLEGMSAELKAARSRAVPVRAREEAVLAERNAGEVALKAEREGRMKAEEALSKLQAEFTAITAENLVAKDKLEGEQDAQKKVEPELEEAVSQGNRFPVQWSKQDETPRKSVDDALRSVTRDIDEVVREAVMAERNAGTLILSAERAARKSAEQALSAAKPGRDEESTEAVMAERMAGALRLRAEQHARKTTEAELAAADSRLKEAVDNAVMAERRSACKLIEAESKAQELAQEAVATSQAEAVQNMQKEMEAERISLAAELAKERELRTGAEEELGRIIVKLDEASRALAYESEERKSEIEMLGRDLQEEKAHTAELMAALDKQRLIDNESDLRHVMLLSEIANLGKELREIGSLADTLTSSDAESGEPSVNTMLELQADMKRMDAQLLDMELRNESGRMENGEMRDDEARQLSPRRKEEGAAVPGAAAMSGLDVPPPTDDSATNKSTPPKDVLKPVLAGSVGWLGWAFGGGGGGGSSGGGGFGGGGGGFSDGDRPSSGLEYWLLMGAAVAGTVFLLKQALIPWMLTRLTPRRHLRLCKGRAARHRDRRARRMLPLDMAGNPCAALVIPLGTHVPYVSLGEEEDMFLDTFHTPVEMSDSDEVDDIITLTNVGLTGLTAPPASVSDELGEWDSRLFKSPALPAFPPKRSPTDDIPHLMSKLAEVREQLAASSCREVVAIETLETKEAEMAVQLDSAASMQRLLEAELADVRRKLTESSEREAVTVEDAKEKQAHTSAAFDNLQSDLDSATQLGISLHTELEDLRQKLAVSSEREALAVEIAKEKQAELSAVVEKMLVRLDSADRLCLSKDAELADARQKLAESSDREAQSVEDAKEKRAEVCAVVENMLARLDSADQLRISLKTELADVRQTLAEAVQRETMAVEALAAAEEENSATVKRMEVEIDNQVQSRRLLEAELAMEGVKVSQLSQQEARAVEASEAVEASKKVIQAEFDRNAQLCRSLEAEITTLRSQVGNKDELMWGALLRTMTALEDLLPFEVPEKKPDKLEDLFLAVQAFAEAVLAAKDRVETALSVRSEVDASEAQLLRLHLAKAEERAENAESEASNGKSLAEELSSEVALLQESLAERMTVLGNSRQKEQMLESDMLKSVYELVEVRVALATTQKQVEEERAKAESVEAARLESSAQFDERLEQSCRAVLNTAGELERERAKVTQLESTLASKSDQLSKMEEKLASVAAAEAKLKDALKTRQEELVVAEAALLALHASVAAKDGELTGLKEKLEEAEAQKEARMDETGTLRRQLEEAVEVLKEQVEQEKGARVSAEATANAAEEARSAEEAIRGAAEASLRSALVKLDEAERGVASKSCEVDEIQAQFGEIVSELEKAAGRLSRTQAEVQKVVEERAGMAVELERVQDDCAAAKTERGEMETAMAALTDNAMALQAEVERVMGEMDGMRGAHEVSCQRLESAQQVNTMVKAALQGLASEVADMEVGYLYFLRLHTPNVCDLIQAQLI